MMDDHGGVVRIASAPPLNERLPSALIDPEALEWI